MLGMALQLSLRHVFSIRTVDEDSGR